MMQSDQQRPQVAVPFSTPGPGAERSGITRKIDCAPRPGATGPQRPITGRGRGEPDPERWASDLRTTFRT